MSRDILFHFDDFIFSYRVGGVLIQNGRILLQKPKDDGYAMIGGHVSQLETAEQALKREFAEELHQQIEIDGLFASGEIFFPWGNKPCQQVFFCYRIHLLEDTLPQTEVFHGYDEAGNPREEIDFCWVPLAELQTGRIVYPQELVPALLKADQPGPPFHFVSREPASE